METSRTMDIPSAGRALGIGRSLAYELARSGQFPVPVLRLGSKLRVPRAPLEKLLGGDANGDATSGAD
jgi:predicted site-specific integrase-resolvase